MASAATYRQFRGRAAGRAGRERARSSLLGEQALRDHLVHDLVGAATDPLQARVAKGPRHRCLLEVAGTAEHLALHLANANSTHAVSYCTEAGLFQQIGIPAVICGPGSIEQAHKPDEYIDVSELRKCEGFMRKLVGQMV